MSFAGSRAALALGLLCAVVGCAAQQGADDSTSHSSPSSSSSKPSSAPSASSTNDNQGSAGSGAAAGSAGSAAPTTGPKVSKLPEDPSTSDGCAANATSKKEGCACRGGETAACWTGPAADRNVGKCHDGLQLCTANGEFATWGPCMGEELDCSVDAGTPQVDAGMPPPPVGCPCVPGAVIQCSEDCSTGIICSLTATKTCLPDHTWSVCHEDLGVDLDLPGVQCRNMLYGCLDVLTGPGAGQNELYVGDCSSQFTCGHAPSAL